jgi:hypothetical protein
VSAAVVQHVALERHYTLQEVARILNVTPVTVQRLFRGVPGVIEFGSDETLHKRKRKFMRIPESVLIRFHERQRTAK